MRSIEEQITLIHEREEYHKKRGKAIRLTAGYAAAVLVFATLMVGAAWGIPKLPSESEFAEASRYGSLILEAPYLGYVIVGIIAFILGILVALLCKQIKALHKMENR